MAVQPDETYEATVKSAGLTESKDKGTPGLAMTYETSAGHVNKVWYITEGTVARLRKNLNECFGITESQLRDNAFLDSIGDFLHGKTCSIVTEADTDANGNVRKNAQGVPYAAVKWMNPSRLGKRISASRVVGLFGGSSSEQEPPPMGEWPDDNGAAF